MSWRFGKKGHIRLPVHGFLVADNGHALVTAAIGGQCITYGPGFIALSPLAEWLFVEIMLDEPVADTSVNYAVPPSTRRPAAKGPTLIEYIASRIHAVSADR